MFLYHSPLKWDDQKYLHRIAISVECANIIRNWRPIISDIEYVIAYHYSHISLHSRLIELCFPRIANCSDQDGLRRKTADHRLLLSINVQVNVRQWRTAFFKRPRIQFEYTSAQPESGTLERSDNNPCPYYGHACSFIMSTDGSAGNRNLPSRLKLNWSENGALSLYW